jgi:hypothetical protein
MGAKCKVKAKSTPRGRAANFRKYRALLPLTPRHGFANHRPTVGDMLQGAAADCNSAEATHAWFDSKIAHHFRTALGKPCAVLLWRNLLEFAEGSGNFNYTDE